MKHYVKVYLHYFGYATCDFMICEIPGCGQKAVDVMHIYPKSIYDEVRNDIKNLMGGCRKHHDEYAVGEENQEWLQEVHLKFMAANVVNAEPLPAPVKRNKRKQLYQTWKKS